VPKAIKLSSRDINFRRFTTGLSVSVCLVGALSCTPPVAIATFAASAETAISAGPAIFADIHHSCARRELDEQRIVAKYPHAGQSQPDDAMPGQSVCASFVPEVKELEHVSSILGSYFRTMQQLAAFDESKVSVQAKEAGESAGTAAILSLNQIDSVAKLSGLITRAFTQHYQRSKLIELLRAADPHVAVVCQVLESVLSKDYSGLLDEEERAMKRRYQRVSGVDNPATVLLLNRAYSEDLAELQRRRAAANGYAAALEQVRDGHHQLATDAGRLKNKEIALALAPYISRIQTLVAQIQSHP